MMRLNRRVALSGLGLFLFSSAGILVALPTQAGLIQAWEAEQRNDPETLKFEKEADGSYRFATKRFPFDGELKNLKATIDDEGSNPDYVVGSVEVELVGLSDRVRQDYARSYALWVANNLFHYDLSAKRWVGARQYREEARARFRSRPLSFSLWSLTPSLFLLLVFVALLVPMIRAQRRQRQLFELAKSSAERAETNVEIQKKLLALTEEDLRFRKELPAVRDARISPIAERAEKSLSLAEDSNRILKEILEALRK